VRRNGERVAATLVRLAGVPSRNLHVFDAHVFDARWFDARWFDAR